MKLSDLFRCFQGVVPSIIATADSEGVPNITYLSQVHFVDERHVAVSCQFFSKTRRNLDQNPRAHVEMMDPVTMQAYRLRLRFLRSEKSGPLFDAMSLRIDAIASHTGMAGVFRLIAADVFEVLEMKKVEGFLSEHVPAGPSDQVSLEGVRSEIRGLQWVSQRINEATDLESLLHGVLEALDEFFQFSHTMVLLCDGSGDRLTTIASHGFGETGVGAEVGLGDGLIGMVAREKRLLRVTSLNTELRYGRAIRREAAKESDRHLCDEIPLPGLPDAQSVLLMPLKVGERLTGVLVAESRDRMRFSEWHEAFLEVIANQIALGIDRMSEDSDEPAAETRPAPRPMLPARAPRLNLTYYRKDDAIFAGDQYLIRNVPARILWKLVNDFQRAGRTEFSNRELRLDSSLGLPEFKDNLESRLILLRHRLKEKCPALQIVPTARGRFALVAESPLDLIER